MARRGDPPTVKDVLAEMKDTAELMVDLAYSAVSYDHSDLAAEVLRLEAHMNELQVQGQVAAMLSARNPDDADQLLGVLQVVNAAEMVADAADDIATVVTHDLGIPPALQEALREAREITLRVPVRTASAAGSTVGAIEAEVAATNVIARRRDDAWLFDPDDAVTVDEGDVLFVRGPQAGVTTLAATVGDQDLEHAPDTDGAGMDELATMLVDMKNRMETAIGLGYSAVLFNSTGLAEAVTELESETDRMQEDLETSILTHAASVDDPAALRGLLHIAAASEAIADAALEMASAVLRDTPPHAVLAEAMDDTEASYHRITVEDDAKIAGITIRDARLPGRADATIIAIKHDDSWHYRPDPETTIHAGDDLLVHAPDAADVRRLATA